MSGLGAFIDGAMRGYSYGMSVEDRKERRERQKKNDDWTDKARQRQEVAWDREDEAYRRAEEERGVLAAIAADAKASYENGDVIDGTATEVPNPQPQAVPSPQPQGEQLEPITVSTRNRPEGRGVIDVKPDQPVQRPSQPRSVIAPSVDAAPQVDTNIGLSPTQRERAKADAMALVANDPSIRVLAERRGMSPEQYVAGMSPEDFEHNLRRITNPQTFDKTADDAAYAEYQERQGQPEPTQADLDQRHRQNQALDQYNVRGQETQQPGAAPTGMPAIASRPDQRPNVQQAAGLSTPAAGAAPQPNTESAVPMTEDVQRAAQAPVAPNMPADEQAEVQAIHERAVSAPPDQGGSPSVAVAAATAPKGRGVVGEDGVIKATEGQRKRASKSFLDHYAETAVPRLVEYYASQGDIEKAQAFEDWAKSREAKSQMESWSKAVHAAAIGDDDAFLDHLADTYNSYDDGYEVIRKGSGFTHDKAGNITGAKVQFKNTKTGEVFVENFADQSDIIELGIYALSPEQVFETLYGQLAQAADVAAEQRKFERDLMLEQAKQGMKAPGENAKLITSAKKALSEQLPYGQWQKMTPEEQDAAAIDYVRRNRGAGQNLDLAPAPDLYTGG